MNRTADLTKQIQAAEATAENARKQEKASREQAEFMESAAEGIRLLQAEFISKRKGQ